MTESRSPLGRFADPELAKQASARAAEVRTEKARRRASMTFDEMLQADAGALGAELLDAAFGRGKWGELDDARRLAALTRACEYAFGRPPTAMPDRNRETMNGKEPEPSLVIS